MDYLLYFAKFTHFLSKGYVCRSLQRGMRQAPAKLLAQEIPKENSRQQPRHPPTARSFPTGCSIMKAAFCRGFPTRLPVGFPPLGAKLFLKSRSFLAMGLLFLAEVSPGFFTFG